ncbi:unnamed protein product [Acanthoscelides obtectus]|uniref:Vacuolar protein sorting-associated protein 33B n=1 Tax=Acanthoscelides obtectus TaxID=200917 RepID=A0A9P0Q284_ACAOB|nr:unnamed protein product [Acanthoscelides obtectus]CAK1636245.1 Vacuolar protein sorting-associated protein 33B [Acanthoscelides obtectus]
MFCHYYFWFMSEFMFILDLKLCSKSGRSCMLYPVVLRGRSSLLGPKFKMNVIQKLASLQEISKAQLSVIFSCNTNTKYLILDPRIIRPLERVCGVKWLKGNGVEKIFKLEAVAPNFNDNAVFYMILAETGTFKKAVDQIRAQIDIETCVANKFHIVVVPTCITTFEDELESLGLLDDIVTLHSFIWMPLYLDNSILSLEIPNIFGTLFVYENFYFLSSLSRTFWYLTLVIGKPKLFLALGQNSKAFLTQYELFCKEKGDSDRVSSDFGAVVVIDRSSDYPAALLTPGTYTALLSEVYTVKTGLCESLSTGNEKYDEKFNPIVQKQSVKFCLDSRQDTVYADIKNRYFTEVTSVLSDLTKQLKSEKTNSKDMALDEMKHYVKTKLGDVKARKKYITNHLMAAESIINTLGNRYEKQKIVEQNIIKNSEKSTSFSFLDEILVTENDRYVSLRLFCLMGLLYRLNENEIRKFWAKYLNHFGYKCGIAFNNLINMGFISDTSTTSSSNFQSKLKIPSFTSSNFYTRAKNLKLVPADPDSVNLKHPTCASYVYGGTYAPLISQIASLILSSTPLSEIQAKLEELGPLEIRNDRGYPLQTRSILICMIGGITYAEIAACNLIETLTGASIVVLSDRIINGNDLMRDILEYPK